MTDHLTWTACADRAVEPYRLGLWLPVSYGVVVTPEQSRCGGEALLSRRGRPPIDPRRFRDVAEEVCLTIGADQPG